MPYLNWKEETALKQEIATALPGGVAGSGPMRLELGITEAQVGALLPLLSEVLGEGGGELRLDLPRNWIIFWKRREGESRLLIAHPQTDEWVATLALSQSHAQLFLEKLAGLSQGENLSLAGLEATGSVSNLDFRLARL